MHLFRRQAVVDPAAVGTISVIDFGPYFARISGGLERVAADRANYFPQKGHSSAAARIVQAAE
jgi:hypothetical protein